MTNLIRLEVKFEDADGYRHLNNSRFPMYFEEGRVALLEGLGLDAGSMTKRGLGFLVRRAEYEYVKQVFAGEVVDVSSDLERAGRTSLNLKQEMTRDRELVGRACVKYFFFDFKQKKPIRIPEEFAEVI